MIAARGFSLFGWRKPQTLVTEMIGAGQRIIRRRFVRNTTSVPRVDPGTTDYGFWDRTRGGRTRGLELSGLMLKPLESKIASGVLGERPNATFKEQSAVADEAIAALNDWLTRTHAQYLRAAQEAEGLGDFYIVINPDLTMAAFAPNMVQPLVDENDYSKIIGWVISREYQHPTDIGKKMVIEDTFTEKKRIRVIKKNGVQVGEGKEYPNLIGLNPVIHIPANRGVDEAFGRPVGQALLNLLYRYNETLDAGLKGNKQQGRPTPVVENLDTEEALEAFKAAYVETITNADGTTEEIINFDSDNLMYLAGSATFKWASPNPFATDTEKLLGLLFYLYLQHSELPEFVLGNAISSSKASAESQMPIFIQFLKKKRGEAQTWLNAMLKVVLTYMAISETRFQSLSDPIIEFAPLGLDDAQLTMSAITLGLDKNIISRETAVSKLPLGIRNPLKEIEQAETDMERLQTLQSNQDEVAVNRAISQVERRLRNETDSSPDGQSTQSDQLDDEEKSAA